MRVLERFSKIRSFIPSFGSSQSLTVHGWEKRLAHAFLIIALKHKHRIVCLMACVSLVMLSSRLLFSQNKTITINVSAFEGYVDTLSEPFKARMKEEYGYDVVIDSRIAVNPNDLYQEAKSGWADVLSISHNLYFSNVWPFLPDDGKQLLQPIPTERIKNYSTIAPVFLKEEFIVRDGKTYGIPFAAGPYGLAYNADLISEPPTSWNDLWNIRYKNLYSLTSDYSECNIYITALALGIDKKSIYNPDKIFEKSPLNEFRTKLNDLAKNARSFWQSTADVNEMKTLALTTTWGYGVQQANAAGQNWKYADVKEGVTAYFDTWALSSTVDPDSIKYQICLEWINHNLDPKIQVLAVRQWGMTPVVQNIESLFTPEEIENFHIGKTQYWEQASFWEVLKPVTYHSNNALWTYAMSAKSHGEKHFVSQREELQAMLNEGGNRYDRGKKLAAEARLKRLKANANNMESTVFPNDLHYVLTLYALSEGKTKSEIIINAVKEYLANHPLDAEPTPTPTTNANNQ